MNSTIYTINMYRQSLQQFSLLTLLPVAPRLPLLPRWSALGFTPRFLPSPLSLLPPPQHTLTSRIPPLPPRHQWKGLDRTWKAPLPSLTAPSPSSFTALSSSVTLPSLFWSFSPPSISWTLQMSPKDLQLIKNLLPLFWLINSFLWASIISSIEISFASIFPFPVSSFLRMYPGGRQCLYLQVSPLGQFHFHPYLSF